MKTKIKILVSSFALIVSPLIHAEADSKMNQIDERLNFEKHVQKVHSLPKNSIHGRVFKIEGSPLVFMRGSLLGKRKNNFYDYFKLGKKYLEIENIQNQVETLELLGKHTPQKNRAKVITNFMAKFYFQKAKISCHKSHCMVRQDNGKPETKLNF